MPLERWQSGRSRYLGKAKNISTYTHKRYYKLKEYIWENFNWEVDKCVLRSDNNPIKNNI